MLRNKRGKMIVVIAGALILLLLAGVGIFKLKSGGKSKGPVDDGPPPVSLPLGEFVVNLADPGAMRYLKTTIVLEVKGTIKAGGEGEGSGADPKVRDAVIEVLSSKKMAELTASGGKDQLRKDIIAAVNKRLEDAKVVDVYFNEFAMQ